MIAAFKTIAGATVECLNGQTCDTGLPGVSANYSQLQIILQIVFAIAGALTVIIIIVSSLRLIASQGNPQEAVKARQGIIYAVVGLILAISAEMIVTYVIVKV